MKLGLKVEDYCDEFALYMKDDLFSSRLHYISAINSFPISSMVELLPPEAHATVYERIAILSATDLDEFNKCVRSLYQRVVFRSQSNAAAKDQQEAGTETSNNGPEHHYICIEGLHTMFQYSQLQDPVEAHASLNDSMLRLRQLEYRDSSVKILLIVPPQEAPEFQQALRNKDGTAPNRSTQQRSKRFKRDQTGILFGDYLWKYYL